VAGAARRLRIPWGAAAGWAADGPAIDRAPVRWGPRELGAAGRSGAFRTNAAWTGQRRSAPIPRCRRTDECHMYEKTW